MIYLASPFTSEDKTLETHRMMQAEKCAAHLMKNGNAVYAPIVYGYGFYANHDIAGDAETWAELNETMIDACRLMIVLMLEGWEESKGVQHEIAIARLSDIPVMYVDPEPWLA